MKKFLAIALTTFMLLPFFSNSALAAANVAYESNHVIIQPVNETTIKVISMATLINNGDTKFDGEVGYGLPINYSNLSVADTSVKYTAEANALVVKTVLEPKGKQSLSYSAELGLTDNKTNVELVYPHDLQFLNILIPKDTAEITITGAKFEDKGEFPFEATTLKQYELKDVKANARISIAYTRNPNAPAQNATENNATENNNQANTEVTRKAPQFHNPGHIRMWNQSALSNFNPHYLMIVLGIILAAIVVYFAYFEAKRRKQLEHVKSDQEERVFKQLIAKKNAIMNKIVELEDDYTSGNLSDEEYKKKMEAYKNHLVQVKLSLRDFVE
jgi:hypothetical protein